MPLSNAARALADAVLTIEDGTDAEAVAKAHDLLNTFVPRLLTHYPAKFWKHVEEIAACDLADDPYGGEYASDHGERTSILRQTLGAAGALNGLGWDTIQRGSEPPFRATDFGAHQPHRGYELLGAAWHFVCVLHAAAGDEGPADAAAPPTGRPRGSRLMRAHDRRIAAYAATPRFRSGRCPTCGATHDHGAIDRNGRCDLCRDRDVEGAYDRYAR